MSSVRMSDLSIDAAVALAHDYLNDERGRMIWTERGNHPDTNAVLMLGRPANDIFASSRAAMTRGSAGLIARPPQPEMKASTACFAFVDGEITDVRVPLSD